MSSGSIEPNRTTSSRTLKFIVFKQEYFNWNSYFYLNNWICLMKCSVDSFITCKCLGFNLLIKLIKFYFTN